MDGEKSRNTIGVFARISSRKRSDCFANRVWAVYYLFVNSDCLKVFAALLGSQEAVLAAARMMI